MTLTEEQQILHSCIFGYGNKRPTEIALEESTIHSCLDQNGIDKQYLSNLSPIFEIRVPDRAEEPEEGEPDPTYKLKTNKLISKWKSWIDRTSIFQETEVEKISDTRYDMRARFSGSDINFAIFFDANDVEKYTLNPNALEFGIAFLDSKHIHREKDVFAWYELLESDFRTRFREHINEYQQSIAAGFADEDTVEEYKRPIRSTIRKYLSSQGYEIRREPGTAVPMASDYNIETGKAQFAAVSESGSDRILLCRCHTTDQWHFHRFVEDSIVSVEEEPAMAHLLDTLSEKIDEYDNILSRRRTIESFSTVLSLVSAVATTFLFTQSFEPLKSFLNTNLGIESGSGNLPLIASGAAFLLVIVIGLVVLQPYNDERKFSWEIPDR